MSVSPPDSDSQAEQALGRSWWSLLRSNRPFSLLFVATAGSATGTYLAALALSWDIYDRTHSGRWVAALLVADFLPIVIIGLTLGPLVDRLPRRSLLIVSDLVRVLTFGALPFVDSPAAIVALAGIGGVATGFFRPAVWAGLPNLVREDERESATALFSTTENVAWIVGPILAAIFIQFSPSYAYSANAVSFLLSAILISGIAARALQSTAPLTRGHWRDVRDGLGLVISSRPLRTVLVVWSTAALASAGVNVGEVALASDSFDAGSTGFAALVVSTGLGLVVGSFWIGKALGTIRMSRLYGGSLLIMAAGFGAAAVAPWLALACVFAACGAVGNGAAIVCNQVLVQRGSTDEMRGRSLAVLMSVYYAFLATGMALAGLMTGVVGGRGVWAIASGIYAVAGALAFVMTRATRTEATTTFEPEPVLSADHSGAERLERLLEEVESMRERERIRERPALPYIPRKRAD